MCFPQHRELEDIDEYVISHADLLRGIYGMGFKKPSKIQEKALPLMLQNPYVHDYRLYPIEYILIFRQSTKYDCTVSVRHW